MVSVSKVVFAYLPLKKQGLEFSTKLFGSTGIWRRYFFSPPRGNIIKNVCSNKNLAGQKIKITLWEQEVAINYNCPISPIQQEFSKRQSTFGRYHLDGGKKLKCLNFIPPRRTQVIARWNWIFSRLDFFLSANLAGSKIIGTRPAALPRYFPFSFCFIFGKKFLNICFSVLLCSSLHADLSICQNC